MYNQMPNDWLEQIKASYPKRSGPMRWPRVFLPVRRALMETCWDDLIAGVKRYAAYIQASGKDGSDFVTTPENFFKDEIYLEELKHQESVDPKITARFEAERSRRHRIESEAAEVGIAFCSLDSTGSIETRIAMARTFAGTSNPQPLSSGGRDAGRDHRRVDVAGLVNRMRVQ